MWKKSETEHQQQEVPNSQFPASHPQPVREQAIIGPSLVVKGDVTGDEDLTIQGQVEGKVSLKNNSVTVGKNGRIKADVYSKVITVEGTVQGNLYGEERIVVTKSGSVKGNLVAPRVMLEDGARFKGSIDMEGKGSEKAPGPSKNTEASSAGTSSPDSGGAKKTDTEQGTLGINSSQISRK